MCCHAICSLSLKRRKQTWDRIANDADVEIVKATITISTLPFWFASIIFFWNSMEPPPHFFLGNLHIFLSEIIIFVKGRISLPKLNRGMVILLQLFYCRRFEPLKFQNLLFLLFFSDMHGKLFIFARNLIPEGCNSTFSKIFGAFPKNLV